MGQAIDDNKATPNENRTLKLSKQYLRSIIAYISTNYVCIMSIETTQTSFKHADLDLCTETTKYINRRQIMDIDWLKSYNQGREKGKRYEYTTMTFLETGGVYLTRFNKIAIQGTPQMAVDKEANSLSRVHTLVSFVILTSLWYFS